MRSLALLPALALLILLTTGCQKTSPFVGTWEGVSYQPPELAEEVKAITITLDEDGFASITAIENDDEEEQYTFNGTWKQWTDKRMEAEVKIEDDTFKANAWLIGPDKIRVVAIIIDDDGQSATGIFERVSDH